MKKTTQLLFTILFLCIQFPAGANNLLWETYFDTEDEFNTWTIHDANKDGTTWFFNEKHAFGKAVYEYNYYNSGDDWLISPAIIPTETTQIMVKYTFHGSFYSEKMEVYFGNSPEPASFTQPQAQHDDIKDEITESFFFVNVKEGEPFYLAFHATSLPYKLRLSLISIQIYNMGNDVAKEYPNRVYADHQLVMAATSKFADTSKNEEIQFADFHEGKEVTEESTIYYVNPYGEPTALSTPYFMCTEAGQHQFYATYGELHTAHTPLYIQGLHYRPELPADSLPTATLFTPNALLIQGTGIRCSYCPNGITAIQEFYDESPMAEQVHHIALHAFTMDDPLYCDAADLLFNKTGLSAFPAMMINFNKKWGTTGEYVNGFKNFMNTHITEALSENPQTGISLASTYHESTNTISVNVGIKTAKAGIFRVTAVLVQDNVYAPQAGTYEPSHDIHHSSVRAISPADGNGALLNCGKAEEKGKVYAYSCEFDVSNLVSSSYNNYTLDVLRDARIVVYVQRMDGYVDNVISCKMNESVAYDYQEGATEDPTVGIDHKSIPSPVLETEVYDLSGTRYKIVQGQLTQSVSLPTGVYLLREKTKSGIRTRKVLMP